MRKINELQETLDEANDVVQKVDVFKYDPQFLKRAEPVLAKLKKQIKACHIRLIKKSASDVADLLEMAINAQKKFKDLQ